MNYDSPTGGAARERAVGPGKPDPLASNVRILLTDDDPVFVSLAETALQSIAGELVVARDGAEALEKLEQAPCDIAIVDLSMPKVDGFRLVAYIRNTPRIRSMPIIVVTTRDDHKALDEAYKLGVNLLLTKPLNWTAFPYQVSAVLRGLAPAAASENDAVSKNGGKQVTRFILEPDFDVCGFRQISYVRRQRVSKFF